MTANPRAGIAMVLLAAALWGTTGTANAIAGPGLSALWFGALRLAVAAAFFALYATLTQRGRGVSVAGGRDRSFLLAAGACMAVYNLAFFAGIRQTGVGAGTAIALGSGPIWAGILQAVVDREAPGARWWLGTLLAVGGGVLLTLGGAGASMHVAWGGVVLCLLSGLSYAVYTLLNKRLAQALPAATITFWAFSMAAALAVPVAWAAAGAPVIGARDAAAVAYTGVVTAGVSYLLFSLALRHITPATGVTLALTEPAVAFILATAFLGERFTMVGVAGFLCVVAGVLAVVRAEIRR
jgi:DME family drug/metabolite transporter